MALISLNMDRSLDIPILPPTHGKEPEEKFEQRFSYLHHEDILHTHSFPTIKVSKTSQV
jgi:hypothetical protein